MCALSYYYCINVFDLMVRLSVQLLVIFVMVKYFATWQGVSRPVVQPGKVLSRCATGCPVAQLASGCATR